MGEDGHGYTRMPGWHTETALGQNLVTAFDLDRDYCAGESLSMIVSEGLAALSMAIGDHVKALMDVAEEFENPEDQEEAQEALQGLYNFAVQAFMGTQMVWSPGKSLKDFLAAGQA